MYRDCVPVEFGVPSGRDCDELCACASRFAATEAAVRFVAAVGVPTESAGFGARKSLPCGRVLLGVFGVDDASMARWLVCELFEPVEDTRCREPGVLMASIN